MKMNIGGDDGGKNNLMLIYKIGNSTGSPTKPLSNLDKSGSKNNTASPSKDKKGKLKTKGNTRMYNIL